MAALTQTTNPTLLDLARRLDPDGSIATIVELMTPISEVLEDMTWIEGNLVTGNRTTVRTGLPAPTWRKMYGGVQPNKSTTAMITDNCGMLEAYAEVDKALADLNGNTAAFRLSEDMAWIAGLNQTMAQTIFYGNEGTQPEAFTGLSPRFNAINGAANAENVIDGLGTGATNNSIWLTYWSPNTVCGIIPKGSTAGIQRKDMGEVTIEDVTGAAGGATGGGRMQAYRTHYRWDAGLTVRDWRAVVRIANIDITTLTKTGATGSDIPDCMFQAMEVVPSIVSAGARPAFYTSRTVLSYLRRQMANKTSGSTLAIEDVGGKKVMTFQGIPLRRVDALAANEARVV